MRLCVAQDLPAQERQRWVQTAADYRAERRGFAPGHGTSDWLEAEQEVQIRIAHRY
jgi:Protein of unknown function (DUF2934)